MPTEEEETMTRLRAISDELDDGVHFSEVAFVTRIDCRSTAENSVGEVRQRSIKIYHDAESRNLTIIDAHDDAAVVLSANDARWLAGKLYVLTHSPKPPKPESEIRQSIRRALEAFGHLNANAIAATCGISHGTVWNNLHEMDDVVRQRRGNSVTYSLRGVA